MANHLTPEELSKEVGLDRAEVIRICIEEHVPIYQGKIDKTLFQAQLAAIGALDSELLREFVRREMVRHGCSFRPARGESGPQKSPSALGRAGWSLLRCVARHSTSRCP